LPSLSLSSLFIKHAIKQIDVLHVDTEGADWKILSQLDLRLWKPRVILYEHKCLTRGDRTAAKTFFEQFYLVDELSGGDTICHVRS
jgi:hypothetical protein